MSNRTRLFVLVFSIAIILCACSIRGIKTPETTGVTEPPATETTPAATSKPTSKPTSTPTPTPTPTSTPTPSPTPTPESVYISREELPEGQLFDKKYYAILPGEGAMYNIYDCYGQIIRTFRFTDGESQPPIGLFEKHEVEKYTYIPESVNESQGPENRWYFPGGYYEWYNQYASWHTAERWKWKAGERFKIVTDQGDTILVKNEDNGWSTGWERIPLPDATEICVYEESWNDDYLTKYRYFKISHDGTVLENICLPDLPYTWLHIVGNKYYMIQNESDGNWDLFDLSGNTVLEDTSPINASYIGAPYGRIYSKGDYFIWNGIAYDRDLNPVPDETVSTDGYLIPGVNYYVNGVPCQTQSQDDWYLYQYPDQYTFAVNTDGASTIAVKSVWGDCAIRDVDAKTVSVLDVSPTMVFLSDYSLYSLKTGEFIRNANIKGRSVDLNYIGYQLTDRYLIFSYKAPSWYPAQFYEQFYIFDEYGNLRYYSSKSQAGPARDDLILLKRGPYIGIADLNGDWVLKTVDPGVKRDAEELTYW